MNSGARGKFLIGMLFVAAMAAARPEAAMAAARAEAADADRAAGLRAEAPKAIAWEGWSDAAFDRARAEKRLVILDLVAVWCHWCHVMEETTYQDPEVIRQIRAHFVALRVDQDSRPDLSNRYEDYGWPATVIFDANGKELVKFAGYIPPERMRTLLAGVVADPTPGPSVRPEAQPAESSSGTALSERQRKDLIALLVQRYDRDQGGWGFSKKFLDFDGVEYGLTRAGAGSPNGDADSERMARETLTLSRKLIDPVWGGLYQYSDSGDWDHPHFEKLLQFQAEGIRLYAAAYAQWKDERDLQAARDILRYVRAFLKSPEGAFYVSQDADLVAGEHSAEYYALDDAARRRRGIPRVDTHLYARESAWMVRALVSLYAVTNEPELLDEAVTAARWVVAQRALPGGGFRHDAARRRLRRRPPTPRVRTSAIPSRRAAPSSRCGRSPATARGSPARATRRPTSRRRSPSRATPQTASPGRRVSSRPSRTAASLRRSRSARRTWRSPDGPTSSFAIPAKRPIAASPTRPWLSS